MLRPCGLPLDVLRCEWVLGLWFPLTGVSEGLVAQDLCPLPYGPWGRVRGSRGKALGVCGEASSLLRMALSAHRDCYLFFSPPAKRDMLGIHLHCWEGEGPPLAWLEPLGHFLLICGWWALNGGGGLLPTWNICSTELNPGPPSRRGKKGET